MAIIWNFLLYQVFFPNAKEGDFQFVTMPNLLIRIHPDGQILYILRQDNPLLFYNLHMINLLLLLILVLILVLI